MAPPHDLAELQNRTGHPDLQEGKRDENEVGPDGSGVRERAEDVHEGFERSAVAAECKGVGAARAHDGVPDIKEADDEKAERRNQPHREGHGEGPHVEARHVEHGEGNRLIPVGPPVRHEPGNADHDPGRRNRNEDGGEEFDRKRDAVQKRDDRAGKRDVENEESHGLREISRDKSLRADEDADEDDGDVAENGDERGHESFPSSFASLVLSPSFRTNSRA